MQTQRTDRELIASFRDGDEGSFNALVLRHQGRVYRTARRILGTHDDADDVVQDVFLKVYRNLKTFRGDSEFSTWIYRITMNASLNAARKRRAAAFLGLDGLFGHESDRSVQADGVTRETPETILLRNERRTMLERAVESLPPKQKAVFTMRYHDGMKFETIATVLHRSVGGVKSNYFHALRKIGAFLKARP